MILDVVDEVRALFEPEPAPLVGRDVALDETGAPPLERAPKTLYLYPTRVVEIPFETGPSRRQEFEIRAELTGPDVGEEPELERDPAVSAFFDDRRDAYFAAVRENQVNTHWMVLRAAEEGPGPATLQHRSLALRLSGYRFVG